MTRTGTCTFIDVKFICFIDASARRAFQITRHHRRANSKKYYCKLWKAVQIIANVSLLNLLCSVIIYGVASMHLYISYCLNISCAVVTDLSYSALGEQTSISYGRNCHILKALVSVMEIFANLIIYKDRRLPKTSTDALFDHVLPRRVFFHLRGQNDIKQTPNLHRQNLCFRAHPSLPSVIQ